MAQKKRSSSLVIEPLESRLLFSATADVALLDDGGSDADYLLNAAAHTNLLDVLDFDQRQDHFSTVKEAPDDAYLLNTDSAATSATQLVFVDTTVNDYQTLVDDILRENAGENIQIILLDANTDGLDQINQTLAEQSNISAVHIVSHGSDGKIELGNATLSEATLPLYEAELQNWAEALTDFADILIYGCNLASSDAGIELLNTLAALTDADVAASDDLTGSAELGGDWILEYAVGEISTQSLLEAAQTVTWFGLLATPSATADTSNVWFGETITGNLITGDGGSGITADTLGDGTTDIKSITYDGVVYDTWTDDEITITADSGTFVIQRDGTYTFTSTATHISANPMSTPSWFETYNIYGFHQGDAYVDGDGDLDLVTNVAPAADVYDSSSGLAVVNGNSTGDNLENSGGNSEALVIDLGASYSLFTAVATRLSSSDNMNWEVFDASYNSVGSGTVAGIGSSAYSYTVANIDPGTSFRYIAFSVADDGDYYRLYDVSAYDTLPANEVFTYEIEDDDSETSSSTLTLSYSNDNQDGRLGYSVSNTNEGDTVTAGSITDADGANSATYQWQFSEDGSTNWTDIDGETGASYVLDSSIVGTYVRVQANYTDDEGTVEQIASYALGTINNTSSDPGSITFSGTETEGETLSAGAISDSDGTSGSTFSYQWQRSADGDSGWSDIAGATSSTYNLQDADTDQYVRITITYQDDTGDDEWVASSSSGQITGINQTPVLGTDAAIDVAENTTTVGTYAATDGDPGDTITYSLTGDDAALFSIDASGNLSFVSGRDRETPTDTGANNVYNVTVVATDDGAGTLSDSQNITVTITDDNSEFTVGSVTDANGTGNSVSESAANTTAVGITASASDGDATDDITYSLIDNAGGRFTIDGTTGVVTVLNNSLLDYETATSHDITVRATSDDGSTSDETFTINLTDDTSEFTVGAVTDTNGTGNSVSESAANTTVVGITASASDGDATDDITYSLQDDAGGAFTIDGSTGVVTVLDNTQIDYESATSLNITVRATSDDSSFTDQVFSIAIADDTSEFSVGAVSDSNGATNSISESAANTSTVGITASAADGDDSDDITYSLQVDGSGAFTIDGSTGVVTVLDNTQIDYESATSLNITVRATSDDGSFTDQIFSIAIIDDTSEFSVGTVADSNGSANSISESAANTSTVGITASASDGDASDDITYSLTDSASGRFTIDASTGVVTVLDNSLLDYESATSHDITVRATSDDGSTSDQTFTINLTDDTSEFSVGAVSDSNGTGNSVSESAVNGTTVGITASASDGDGTDGITYSLTDDASGLFTIHSTTGVVTVLDNSSLNYENATSHNITVRATSDDGSTSDQIFSISVTDVDEFNVGAVTDSNAGANTLSEGANNGDTVGITASAADADGSNNTITYSLTDDAGGRFSIDGSTGVVTVANDTLLDYESNTSHSITVLATSSDTSTSSQSFTINMTDVDEFDVGAVTDGDATANSISESTSNGTTVGITATASDDDGDDDVTFSLSDDAGGRFTIDGATGVVTVANASALDYETDTSHDITVLATSDDGSTSSQTFTINVTDTSESGVGVISDNDVAANTLSEAATNGDTVGITALATDPDGSDSVSYSLSDDAGGRFTIHATTGVVTVADETLLDYESATSHTITVLATSTDTSTNSQSFTINLTDDNSEFSVGAVSDANASANTVSESAANGTAVGITGLATDADSTDDITYSLTDNASGRFTIDGTTGVVTVLDNSLLDYESATSHSITIRATSDDGSTSDQSFTINITDDTSEFTMGAVSDANASANSVSENAANGATVGITASATDADGSDDTTYSLTDDAGGRFTIDGATGVVTVLDNSLLDYETATSHDITVRATSDDGSTSDQTFTISLTDDTSEFSVGAVSDANAATNSVSESAANGTTVGITASASDGDGSDDITYSLTDDASGRFTIDGSTGVVTVLDNSLLDYETTTSHSITVRATSDDGSTSDQSFSVNLTDDNSEASVSAVSDANASANSVSESAANGSTVGITGLATDADAGDGITYSLADNASGRFTIDGSTGVVTVLDNSLLDYETATSHSITVRATSDDGSTNTQSFTINLTDDTSEFSVGAVSDANATANSVSESAANGTTVGITASASDGDGSDDITYSLTDDAGGRFTIDGSTGVVTVLDNSLLDYETTTSHSITVRATSDDGSTNDQSFTVNLTDDNSEASVSTVSDTNASANSVSESAANGSAVGITALATDADATDDIAYSLADNASGRFTIDGSTGVVTVLDNSLLDYETATSHSITVRATSDDGSTNTQSFTINLADDTSEFSVGAVSDANAAANSVSESAANGTAVGITASASDGDGSDGITYSLTDDAGGRFSIDGSTGAVTVLDNSLLDYETTTSHSITVRATSDDGSTSDQSFTVNLTDDNSEASVSAVSDADATINSVSETTTNGTVVGITASATDADSSDTVTYSLSDNAGGRFDIDGTTGVVTILDFNQFDYETATSHNITILATSSDGSTSSQGFTVNVTDDTSEVGVGAISDTDATLNVISEAALNGTAVGITANATDADGSDSVSYTLSDDAGGRFGIDANTGVVTLLDNTLLDYETATSHTITVLATSTDTSTSSQSFTVTLTDADEFDVGPINDTDAAANEVSESAANGSAVGITVFASDADGTDTITYSLSDDAGGRFSIDANTGVVSVLDNSLLDYETNTSHNITVVANSSDGSSDTQTYNIAITDQNEVGSLSFTGNATEDQTLSATLSDPDGISGTANYQWQRSSDGSTWVNITGATANTYQLTDNDVNNFVRVTAAYTDDGGNNETLNSAATGLVANINDPATITLTGTAADGQTLTAAVADIDGTGATVNYQWQTSSDGFNWADITGATNISYVLTNADVSQFIRVTANFTDARGNAEAPVSNASAQVTNVNDAPTVINPVLAQTADEDSAFTFTVPANTFADADGDALSLSATIADGSNLPAWLSFNASTNTFSGTPAETDAGTLNIRLNAADASGANVNHDFVVVVNNVNDAPTVANITSITNLEDASGDSVDLRSVFADEEDASAALTFTLVSNSNSALVQTAAIDNNTGALTLGYTPDGNGSASITVRATDSGGASTDTVIAVNITPVNDAPVASNPPLVSTDSEYQTTATVALTDVFNDLEDGQNITYEIVSNSNTNVAQAVTIDPTTGELAVNYAPQTVGQSTLIIRATDSEGATADATIELVVTNSKPTAPIVTPVVPTAPPVEPEDSSSTEDEAEQEQEPEAEPTSKTPIDNAEETTPDDVGTLANNSNLAAGAQDFLQFANTVNKPLQNTVAADLVQQMMDKQEAKQKAKESKQNFEINVIPSLTTPLANLIGLEVAQLDEQDIVNFNNEIKRIKEDISAEVEAEKSQKAIFTGITVSLTTGVIVWGLRAGSLLFTLFSMLPLWKGFDPLPVVTNEARRRELEQQRKDQEKEDKERNEVGYMFDEKG